MGLLSANAIKAAIAAREIIIDPAPNEEQFDSDSVDVHPVGADDVKPQQFTGQERATGAKE